MLDDGLDARFRKHCVAEAGNPMRFRCQKGWLDERQRAPLCDRDMVATHQLQNGQGIGRGLFHGTVAMNDA